MAEAEETKVATNTYSSSMNLNQLSLSIWAELAPLKTTSSPVIQFLVA